MWVFGGGPRDKFNWVYQYHQGRGHEIPSDFFEDFKGYLHVDGYAGYNHLANNGAILTGCFAHARRKFIEVIQTSNKKKGLADWAVKHIRKLYAIEKQAKEQQLNPEEIKKLRQEKSKPLLDELKAWLDKHALKVPPKTPIGKAITYCINQWEKLSRYIDDGRLDIDNNKTERAVKPFVISRKN